ncbi:phage tail protein [Paenibacillus medicaginis]|uniref:phage tail protein n=1 Tax=Paenibacillus medicaginis TaxID=1470560 RepID=UPI0040558BD8
MASDTEHLKLLKKDPLTDGNETFNIQTMLNDNWDKLDDAVGSLQDEIANLDPEIPEGSTTQKGIVQLSSATNSTSETLAATPKAVKAAYDLAASKLDKNTAFIELRDGATTAGPAFIDFHSGASVTDFDSRIIAEGGNGNTGGGNLSLQANNIIMNGSTTLNGWTSVKNNMDVVRDGGTGLRLIGSTHTYIPLYPKGLEAGRKGWFGFGNPNTNDIQIVNEASDGRVILQGANVEFVGPVNAGKVWVARDPAYGTVAAISLAIGDSDTGFHWLRDGYVDIYSNGQVPARLIGGEIEFKNTSGSYENLRQAIDRLRNRHIISSAAPSGGNDGDIWFQYQ